MRVEDETNLISEYEDIINLPHHQSRKRPHMAQSDRAAQFAPFAALTGYGDAIKETARINEEQVEERNGYSFEGI